MSEETLTNPNPGAAMTQLITLRMLLVPPILLAMAGCASTDYDKQSYDFDARQSRTRAILDAQHARGAAADASLNRHHFEDGRLNGLGRDKLDRMLAAGGLESLVVHVDFRGPDAEVDAMVQAVQAYLAAGGVVVTEQMVVAGAGAQRTAAASRLGDLRRLEGRGVDNVGSAQSDVMASQQAELFGGQ